MFVLLWQLFVSYLKIGFFGFGGGYTMLALIEYEIVQVNRWLSSAEFIDIIAVAEMTPGPVAINAATFTGYRVAGITGAAVATLGVVFPSLIIALPATRLISCFTHNPRLKKVLAGIHPAVIALMGLAAVVVGKSAIVDLPGALFAAVCFLLLLYTRLHPLLFVGAGAIFGLVYYL
ncbi:MAG: chromate transporter [Bacillota bacterium]